MAVNLQHVRPGDLITASLFNLIVDTLVSLQAQIDDLGSNGESPPPGAKPVIDFVTPSPVKAGSTMTIHGNNFGVPAVVNTVTLGGIPLDDFQAGSTDQLINIGVPGNLPGVPGTKELVVSTPSGGASDPKGIQIAPPDVVLEGHVELINVSGSLGEIAEAKPVLLQFRLDGTDTLSAPERYRIVVTYQNVIGASEDAWKSATTFIGTTGADHHVDVTPLAPVNVGIQVVVPNGAKSVEMSVQAVSVHNDPESSSAPQMVTLTVGEAPPAADPSIAITLPALPNTHANVRPNATGDGLDIRFGANPIITVDATMGHAGDYTFEGAVSDPDTNIWRITDLPQTMHYADGQGQQVQFRLRLVPSTPPAAGSVTRTFTLTATRQGTDGVGQISNFRPFVIGGFTA